MADLNMLQEKPELKSAFFCPNGDQRLIEWIGVDGANDKRLAHLRVQYCWTEGIFCKKTSLHLLPHEVVALAI